MRTREDQALRRDSVAELLRQIDDQRRRRLLLEAAGAHAPALEREAEKTRRRLTELVTDW